MVRKGFSLVEVLVVIAVLALIMAILLPVFARSRQDAKTVVCGARIKQLSLAAIAYATMQGAFPPGFSDMTLTPPPGGYAGNHAADRMGWWWFDYLGDYLAESRDNNSALWCPSRHVRDPALEGNLLSANYGVNRSIFKSPTDRRIMAAFVGASLGPVDIPRSAETVLLLDSGYSVITWWNATASPPAAPGRSREDMAYVPGLSINRDLAVCAGQEWDAVAGRHSNNKINIGFADGHVARRKADFLLVEKRGDCYENLYPSWLPTRND